MLGHLEQSGFDVTRDHEESDAIIVNTCAFVEDAKSESLDVILQAAELRAQREGKRVFVTGCMAQRYGADLSEQLPEVDGIVGFERYGELPATLRATLAQPPDVDAAPAADLSGERVRVGQATVPFRPEGRRFRLTPPHTAYLRVAEGCDHACTFCAIPGFRGKFRSKAFDSVLSEARMLVAEGVVELNLIAEDTNQYGMDKCGPSSSRARIAMLPRHLHKPLETQTIQQPLRCRKGGPGLAELLADLAEIEGLRWIRILYAYPSYFSEELIDEIARNDKVCKYIDIPLQHMSNLTLLAMNRPPRAYTEGLLRKLRERIPGLVLRTTFIAGFPGETDAQHRELVDFCKSFRFDRMGAFAYSQEDGTAAFNLPEQVRSQWRCWYLRGLMPRACTTSTGQRLFDDLYAQE